MPEIGVFTNDIRNELIQKNADLAVHSWKDYPIVDNQNSQIYATLKRGDIRDILFLKKKINPNKNILKIMILKFDLILIIFLSSKIRKNGKL